MPWLIQLEIIRSQAPELNSQSHSLELMPRAQVSFLRPARISAHTIAIGVRESVLPPRPTVSPSFTSLAASSSVTTFSWRLRSRSTSLDLRFKYASLIVIARNECDEAISDDVRTASEVAASAL